MPYLPHGAIDSRATNHMTSNSSLFTTFHSHPSTCTVTLEDGSKSCVLRLDTINPTPLIPLTYILSLPHFPFDLIFVSKLTRTLNCGISFFSDYCMFQDLLTKRIIGRGQVSGGLYILDPELPKPYCLFWDCQLPRGCINLYCFLTNSYFRSCSY